MLRARLPCTARRLAHSINRVLNILGDVPKTPLMTCGLLCALSVAFEPTFAIYLWRYLITEHGVGGASSGAWASMYIVDLKQLHCSLNLNAGAVRKTLAAYPCIKSHPSMHLLNSL